MKKQVIYALFAVNFVAVVLLALWTYGWIGDYEKEETQSRGTPPQVVDIGSGPNTGTGDPLRTAFNKININFSAVYDSLEKWTDLIGPGGSMTWPGTAGIPVYTGTSSWGTSIADNSANWNAAHGWGNHASAGYYVGTDGTIMQLLSSSATGLTYTNSTGVFSLTSGYTIPLSTDITNWNTAFGWGDHSDAGYVEAQAVVGIVEGVVEDALEDAPIGVAVEDVVGGTTGRDRYMSPTQVYNYVAENSAGSGMKERLSFTIGDVGAPEAGESTISHTAFENKEIFLYRKGVLSPFTYSQGIITVPEDWELDELVDILLWPEDTWTHLVFDVQNLVLWSEELQRYSASGPHYVSNGVTAAAGTDLDLMGNPTLDVLTSEQDYGTFWTVATVLPETNYVFSFDVKRGTMTSMRYRIRDRTNGTNFVTATGYGSQTNSEYPVRISVPFTTPADCVEVGLFILDQGTQAGYKGTLHVGRMQLSTPGKLYIKTEGTIVQ